MEYCDLPLVPYNSIILRLYCILSMLNVEFIECQSKGSEGGGEGGRNKQ